MLVLRLGDVVLQRAELVEEALPEADQREENAFVVVREDQQDLSEEDFGAVDQVPERRDGELGFAVAQSFVVDLGQPRRTSMSELKKSG